MKQVLNLEADEDEIIIIFNYLKGYDTAEIFFFGNIGRIHKNVDNLDFVHIILGINQLSVQNGLMTFKQRETAV